MSTILKAVPSGELISFIVETEHPLYERLMKGGLRSTLPVWISDESFLGSSARF